MLFIAFHGDGVDDHDVAFERVVIAFAKLDLPCAEAFCIIEDIFKRVEIDERAFEFVDV